MHLPHLQALRALERIPGVIASLYQSLVESYVRPKLCLVQRNQA